MRPSPTSLCALTLLLVHEALLVRIRPHTSAYELLLRRPQLALHTSAYELLTYISLYILCREMYYKIYIGLFVHVI